jgi:putative flippase GtrA
MQLKSIYKSEIVRFLIIGILNTIIGYLIFVAFYFFIEERNFALSLTYIFSILFNYKTYAKYVFTVRDKQIFINFVIIYISIFIFNISILEFFINILLLNIYISQFLAICIVTPILYILNKRYVFVRSVI